MPQQKRKVKIACPSCGQKLDVTDMPPFSTVNCPACSFELIVPTWFSNYLLEAPEGTGGMAIVYRALDITLDREVAIKVLNRNLDSKVSPGLFLHEARIAATINHPAVVPIYSCGEWDGSTYIVMQYMGGGTLEQRLKKAGGRLPVMETCRWMRDVCEGFNAAHEHGIIHHDVKPANLLLDLDSNVKIADFGLSQAISGKSADAYLDPTQMWLSPHYVSPEKVLTGEENAMGDVYSLGASFYHLLTGQLPFQSDNIQELVNMRLQQDPVRPDLVRPDITPALSSIILDMMNRKPDARPSYKQIVARINEAVRAIMRPDPAPLPQTEPAPPPQKKDGHKVLYVPANRTTRRRSSRRTSHLTILLILFFLMCALCAIVFLPRFIDQRTLLDTAPALKHLYGDLPPESFSFLSDSFFKSPVIEADFAISNPNLPIQERYAAAWVSGISQLFDASPSAKESAADLGDQLRFAASRTETGVPPSDAYCLAVLSRLDSNQPDVYFSPEQHVRVLLGRLVRTLYDLPPGAFQERVPERILLQFDELLSAFNALPEGSWLTRLFAARMLLWNSALSGDTIAARSADPVFQRLFSAPSAASGSSAFSGSSNSDFSNPFGIPSRKTSPENGF